MLRLLCLLHAAIRFFDSRSRRFRSFLGNLIKKPEELSQARLSYRRHAIRMSDHMTSECYCCNYTMLISISQEPAVYLSPLKLQKTGHIPVFIYPLLLVPK